MTYRVPERIKEKVKMNYVAKKCRDLGICDITAEEIAENNGYQPELLDRVVNTLYLKELGKLDEFRYEGNNNQIHYVTHAGNNPKGPIKTGEIKSPLSLFLDGLSIEEIKKMSIGGRPRSEVCFAIDNIGDYGPYVFAMPIEDLMKQEKIGFGYELNGHHTVHSTHKDFDEEEFLKYVDIVYGRFEDKPKEFKKIDKIKKKIRTAKQDKKNFVLNILIDGIPENPYVMDNFPVCLHKEFNSFYTKKCLQPIEKIIDECCVNQGVVRTPTPYSYDINKKYWDMEKYLIISAPERDKKGNEVVRKKGIFDDSHREFLIFDKEKLLSKLEEIDEKTLEEILSSYIKNVIYKNKFVDETKHINDLGKFIGGSAHTLYALNELEYETGFEGKNTLEINRILDEIKTRDPKKLDEIKEKTFEQLTEIEKNNRELEYLSKYKEADKYHITKFGKSFANSKEFFDYFYSTVKEGEHSVENMNTDDLLEVLNKMKERMNKDKENYLENCKVGKVKLTDNTIFLAPEKEREEWEKYFKETKKELKRFYYKKDPKEFFDDKPNYIDWTHDTADFVGNITDKVRSSGMEGKEGERIGKDTKGLPRVCLNLMAKEKGYITDFGAGFGNPMYEFNPELYGYFNECLVGEQK